MSTKATLKNCLSDGKSEFDITDLTKSILNQIVDRIDVRNEKTAAIFFKSGLIMEKDFIKTI